MLAFVLHIFLANYPASLINLRKDYGVDSFQIHLGESAHPWRYSCRNHLVGGGADIGRQRSGYPQQGLRAHPSLCPEGDVLFGGSPAVSNRFQELIPDCKPVEFSTDGLSTVVGEVMRVPQAAAELVHPFM